MTKSKIKCKKPTGFTSSSVPDEPQAAALSVKNSNHKMDSPDVDESPPALTSKNTLSSKNDKRKEPSGSNSTSNAEEIPLSKQSVKETGPVKKATVNMESLLNSEDSLNSLN